MNPIRLKIIERFDTQIRFANAAGISEGTVSKIVNGLKRPTDKERQRFALLLEVPAEKLFGEESYGQQQAR
jgi:transcriptional regulator with XRE-family HTH domain